MFSTPPLAPANPGLELILVPGRDPLKFGNFFSRSWPMRMFAIKSFRQIPLRWQNLYLLLLSIFVCHSIHKDCGSNRSADPLGGPLV